MFSEGSIVYFKNPMNFGRILNTEIGPRWCLAAGCPELDTAPVSAATAGILKTRFIVIAVHDNADTKGALIEVASEDQPDIIVLARPDFFSASGSSSILTTAEKRMLFYLQTCTDFFDYEDEEEIEEAESEGLPLDNDGGYNVKVRIESTENPEEKACSESGCKSCSSCSSCGSCKGNGRKEGLAERAAAWEKAFGGRRSRDAEFEDLLDQLTEAVVEKLNRRRPEPRRQAMRDAGLDYFYPLFRSLF